MQASVVAAPRAGSITIANPNRNSGHARTWTYSAEANGRYDDPRFLIHVGELLGVKAAAAGGVLVGNGGTESQFGGCKDRRSLSWQITPRALTDALAAGGGEAKRAFEAMMTMKKIDIAAIEAARRG